MKHACVAVALAVILCLVACAQPATDIAASKTKTIRLAVATFSHETCTFLPDSTGIKEWEFYGPPERGDAVLRNGAYIGGFVRAAKEHDHVELVGILSPRDAKGGLSGSWITQEAFDKYSNGVANDIKQTGPYDGVFLALHGAMAVTGVPKPEAEMVRRVRAVVGPTVPIYVTLDLHANDDHELSDAASGVLIIKRYPHYDAALQGVEEEWLRSAELRPALQLDAFVVMPNHLHGILRLKGRTRDREVVTQVGVTRASLSRPPRSLGSFVAGFKAAVSSRVSHLSPQPSFPLWQRGYHDRIVRDERSLDAYRRYIALNPYRWGP